jgi:hypothetical protein
MIIGIMRLPNVRKLYVIENIFLHTKFFFLEKFATGHHYFVPFAKTHCPIASLLEHTALPKTETLVHFLQNRSSQRSVKLSVFGTTVCSGKCVTKF